MKKSTLLGSQPIGKLLASQSIPAAVGFMVMTLNTTVDTIFVGQFIGKLAIGAVSIVTPISFLMSSFGMALGIGGASIISRAFGSKNQEKAQLTFNNQISLLLILITVLNLTAFSFTDFILNLFGAKGDLLPVTRSYFLITLIGIPFLSVAMMANNNLRAEGKPKVAMMVLIIPSIVNMILDYFFIVKLNYGIQGAAWATTLAYLSSGAFMIYYFTSGKTELKINPRQFIFSAPVIKEIASLGSVSIIRQSSISILTIVLNYQLFIYGNQAGIGGETAISIYAIPNRIAMFAFFPLIGISQGFVPIAGYNYGARQFDRVKLVVKKAIYWGLLISGILITTLLLGANSIPKIFAAPTEIELLKYTPKAIFIIFLASPVVIFQLVGSSYYQAIGKATPALFLTLTKQFFILTPLVAIFPFFYGLEGIWYAFPVADIGSALICGVFLKSGLNRLNSL